MDIFDSGIWVAPIINSCRELDDQFKGFNLIGKCIREIWNIGIIFDEDSDEQMMFLELDEPIIFFFDELHLEILFSEPSTVRVARDTLTCREISYQGVECGRRAEKYLSVVLNSPITAVVIGPTDTGFDHYYWPELPENEKHIGQIVLRFDSGYSLHIEAWYDYMHVLIRDRDGEIPKL